MPSVSKKQQKFMGIVRSIQKGEQPASKFSKKAQDVAKNMKRKDVKKYASTKHKNLESILSENPIVAATVMQMTKMQMKNPKTGKSVKASTPLRDKSHPLHKKSKSLFQRIKDKLSRKKDKPKKQSKADVDFYKKQYTGESVNERDNVGMAYKRTLSNKVELKKLKDAIEMFQKRIKKQGRVTNARDEDHLKNLIKVYKEMGGKGVRESVNENFDKKRKFGEPLPTLADVKRKHQQKISEGPDDVKKVKAKLKVLMREESRLRLAMYEMVQALYLDPTKGNKELGSELQKKYKKGVTTFMRDAVAAAKKAK
jgi:hypothetical protein|tara:strand:+ start:9772 stop:10704 length:933 start_codon:yes stop_codon:yes gene_type:complete